MSGLVRRDGTVSPFLVAACLSILATGRPAAQDVPAPGLAPERPAPVVDIRAENERKLYVAFDYLYDLDFDPAMQVFAEVAAAEPRSAAVAAFWSCALLYQMLAEQGSLQSQLFVTNEFLENPPPPVDPALDARYVRVRTEAETRAERRLQTNADDVDALFAQGLAYGNTANYLAGIKGQYFRALRVIERAYDIHKRLRRMRPDIHDTGIVLGVREYVLGTLPRGIRILLLFMGDRERGLEYLRDTAGHGEFLGPYAKVLLAMASIRDHDLMTATSLAEQLIAHYPRNPLLRIELLKLYRRQQRFDDAEQLADELLGDLATRSETDPLLERLRADAHREREKIDTRRAAD
jgi:tetratricopeptide (TPR) repeat protein